MIKRRESEEKRRGKEKKIIQRGSEDKAKLK
jgi:hypothetical protein